MQRFGGARTSSVELKLEWRRRGGVCYFTHPTLSVLKREEQYAMM